MRATLAFNVLSKITFAFFISDWYIMRDFKNNIKNSYFSENLLVDTLKFLLSSIAEKVARIKPLST